MKGLNGKVVLITGAAQGIGKAVAMRFAEEGAIVILNDLNSKNLEATRSELTIRFGTGAVGGVYCHDIGTEMGVETLFEELLSVAGKLDILVNNAGINREHASHEFPSNDLDDVLDVNLKGAFYCSKLALRHFIKRNYAGVIINNSSNHEMVPKPRYIAYAMSKGGLGMMMRTLALEYSALGIRVNNVAPGATVTPLNKSWVDDKSKRKAVESHIPLGRAAEADEIAAAFAFLASDDARYITGQTLYVDGGLTIYPEYRENWAS